jgi:hypothetical protein
LIGEVDDEIIAAILSDFIKFQRDGRKACLNYQLEAYHIFALLKLSSVEEIFKQ